MGFIGPHEIRIPSFFRWEVSHPSERNHSFKPLKVASASTSSRWGSSAWTHGLLIAETIKKPMKIILLPSTFHFWVYFQITLRCVSVLGDRMQTAIPVIFPSTNCTVSLQHQEESYHWFWRIEVLGGILYTWLSNASNKVSDPLSNFLQPPSTKDTPHMRMLPLNNPGWIMWSSRVRLVTSCALWPSKPLISHLQQQSIDESRHCRKRCTFRASTHLEKGRWMFFFGIFSIAWPTSRDEHNFKILRMQKTSTHFQCPNTHFQRFFVHVFHPSKHWKTSFGSRHPTTPDSKKS